MNGSRIAAATLAGLLLTGCAARQGPSRSRTFQPPAGLQQQPDQPSLPEPPVLIASAAPLPNVPGRLALPSIPRPTDGEFLIQSAERRLAAGKRALQEGRKADARREFDAAIDRLLSRPELADPRDRDLVRRRLESMADEIYHYDLDQLGVGVPEQEIAGETEELEEILEMTFPIDPSLRGKVREQIQATISDLPLIENDAVLSYINYFLTPRGRKVLLSGFARSGRYRDMILRIMAEEGIPEEIVFVAQAESKYDPRALSRTRNLGVWQFGKATGKEWGLVQTSLVDERRDPEKATRAAARMLRDLYNHFGDWHLALAAYNCGPGCVDSAILRTGYADFWELRRLRVLPLQTANYVPAILAMTIMFKNAAAYELGEIEFDAPVEYESLELPTATSMALIAAAVDRPVSEIQDLNPALLKTEVPAGHVVRVPAGTLGDLEAALQVVPLAQRKSWKVHKVQESDTLASIAKQYRVAVAQVTSANHGVLPAPGSFAAIPSGVASAPAAAAAKPAAAKSKPKSTSTASAKNSKKKR